MSSADTPQQFYLGYLVLLGAVFAVVVVKERLDARRRAERRPESHPESRGGSPESTTQGDARPTPEAFASFQRLFLFVFLVMMAADWMQGPYVYRLYSYYGFSRADNAVLFIAGFGSSLVFGTWAGPIADTYGRRFATVLYGLSYTLSCLTKHIPIFGVLLVGRLLGGFATSILWSCFESWMVAEHKARGFSDSDLKSTFGLMTTLNGLVAIASGFVAQWAVDAVDHPVAPFDVSALFLIVGTLVVVATWRENFGDASRPMAAQMRDAWAAVRNDRRVLLTGLQQSLFEGAMYTFVFLWTPALEKPGAPPVPHGLVFASFMIACSLGGTLFGRLSGLFPAATLTVGVYVVAAAAMAVAVVAEYPPFVMAAFIAFEIAVGVFWPAMGTLRAEVVPEGCRASVMNLFRVPLNTFVCFILSQQKYLSVQHVFAVCAAMHVGAALTGLSLSRLHQRG